MMSDKYEILRGGVRGVEKDYFTFGFESHNTSLWHLRLFFTLQPSLESSRLLISCEGNIKEPKLSPIRGVLLGNLHQRCASETIFLGLVQHELSAQEYLDFCLKKHLKQSSSTNSFSHVKIWNLW